jgi:hypothetical protein
MTDCADCKAAAAQQWHGFRSNCRQCLARGFSRGPDFFRAKSAGRLDKDYLDLLQSLGLTHIEVKQAAAEDAMQRGAAC